MCFWADVLICMHIKVAMYAIDAMRQLAFKFLEKDELTSFHFQRDFLKPFDHIIAHATSPVIRELVVRCLTQVHDRITSVHARTRTHTGATAPSPHHALALTPAPTCRAQVVRSTARNIKSGWKTIFHVLLVAARDDSETVCALAYDLVLKLVEETLGQVVCVCVCVCVRARARRSISATTVIVPPSTNVPMVVASGAPCLFADSCLFLMVSADVSHAL